MKFQKKETYPPPQAENIDPAALSLRDQREAAAMARKRELLAKVRLIREGQINRAGQVRNGDPQYVYFWVFRDPQEIDKYTGMQAEIVRGDDPAETSFKKEDGTHRRGDTILMRLHRDMAEAYAADRELRAIEAIEGHKQEFIDWAERERVPVTT